MRKMFIINIFFTMLLSAMFIYLSKVNFTVMNFMLTILAVVIYTSLILLVDYKKRIVINILFIIISFVVTTANSFNVMIKGQVITISQVRLFKELLGVTDTVGAYITYKNMLIIFIPIIWIALTIKYFKVEKTILPKKIWVTVTLSFVVLNVVSYLGNSFLYSTIYSPNEYVQEYGFASYYARELLPFTKGGIDYDVSAVNLDGVDVESDMFARLEDKSNVIFINAESLDFAAVDEQVTPTLYKAFDQGMVFENYYTLTLNTNASEFSSMSSVPPPVDNSKLSSYNDSYDTIPKMFEDKGYCTYGIHFNTQEYYNRKDTYKEMFGFQNTFFTEDLDFPPTDDLWYRDEVGFNLAIDKIEEKGCEKNFTYYMTTYGHSNYKINKRAEARDEFNYVRELHPDYDEYFVTYLSVQKSLDEMLRSMETYYEQKGELDDTVFIIVSDHFPYTLGDSTHVHNTNSETYIEKKFGKSDFDRFNVPLVIYDPTQKMENRSEYVSNVNILPMMGDLFNLEYSYAYGTSPFRANHNNYIEWLGYGGFGMLGEGILYTRENGVEIGDKFTVEELIQKSKYKAVYIYGLYE